jgi:uncharacterized protein YkwD
LRARARERCSGCRPWRPSCPPARSPPIARQLPGTPAQLAWWFDPTRSAPATLEPPSLQHLTEVVRRPARIEPPLATLPTAREAPATAGAIPVAQASGAGLTLTAEAPPSARDAAPSPAAAPALSASAPPSPTTSEPAAANRIGARSAPDSAHPAAVGGALPPAPVPPGAALAPPAAPAGVQLSAAEADMLAAMNAERAKAGLPALVASQPLVAIARVRTTDMLANGYFSHVSPTGETWIALVAAAGLHVSAGGENLARVPGDPSENVAVAIQMLMASPSHRANILSGAFDHVGVGVAEAGGMTVYTTIFTD